MLMFHLIVYRDFLSQWYDNSRRVRFRCYLIFFYLLHLTIGLGDAHEFWDCPLEVEIVDKHLVSDSRVCSEHVQQEIFY